MSWEIEFSNDADKFLNKNQPLEDDLIDEIKKLIQKLRGETVSLDIRKLHGNWEKYYRIKKGKVRIILHIDHVKEVIFVDTIDFRGDVYK